MKDPMMTCEEVLEEIDTLTAKRRAVPAGERAFHEHLTGCAVCRKRYEEVQAQNQMLDGWVVPAPRGNIQAQVMAGIARMERELRQKEQRPGLWDQVAARLFGHRYRVPRLAALAFAALLLISLGLNAALLYSQRTRGQRFAASPSSMALPPATPRNVVTLALPPALTPSGAGNEALQSVVQHGLAGLGSYAQPSTPMPLGIIVILGMPPQKQDVHPTLTDL